MTSANKVGVMDSNRNALGIGNGLPTDNNFIEYTCIASSSLPVAAVGRYCVTATLTSSATLQVTNTNSSTYSVLTGYDLSNSYTSERTVSAWFGAEANNKKAFYWNLAPDGGGANHNLVNTPIRGLADEDLNVESHSGSSTVYVTLLFEVRNV